MQVKIFVEGKENDKRRDLQAEFSRRDNESLSDFRGRVVGILDLYLEHLDDWKTGLGE